MGIRATPAAVPAAGTRIEEERPADPPAGTRAGRRRDKVILVANTAFFVDNFLMGIVRAIEDSGCTVVVACPEDPHADRMRARGSRVIPLRNLSRKGVNPFTDLLLTLELLRIYHRESPRLVLHFTVKPNIYGGFACALLGIKAVNVITGLGYLFIKKSPITALAKQLYRLALRKSAKVAFLNRDDMEVFLSGGMVRESNSFLLPGTGIDASHFRPAPATPGEASGPDRPRIFLMLGRILWDKGIAEFAEAAASVKAGGPPAEFWILGAPDPGNPSSVPETFLKEKEAAGIIRHMGSAVDVRAVLSRADVIVLPSYREGIPRALLEAMAMEKPVVATDASGCRDVVADRRDGLLVPVRDAAALASAMREMSAMGPEGRAALGRNGREKVLREFDDGVVSRIFLSHVAGLLEA